MSARNLKRQQATFTIPGMNEPVTVTLLRDEKTGQAILRAADEGLVKSNIVIENSGMREVRIATAISDVNGHGDETSYDPATGVHEGRLLYRGYNIKELVEKTSYEEVSYLLLKGDLPDKNQLDAFKGELAAKAVLSGDLQDQLTSALRPIKVTNKTDAMDLLSTLVSIMATQESLPVKGEEARYDSTLRTVAVMPTLIGLVNAHMQGKLDEFKFAKAEDFGDKGKDFSYAKLLLSALQRKDITTLDEKQVSALDKYLLMHAEHGNNISSFTARCVSSAETKAAAWRTPLGAMQSLAGNLHGNASNDALSNLKKILHRPEATIEEKVDGYIKQIEEWKAAKKAQGKEYKGPEPTVEGFGHGIYVAKDPRASALQAILRECKDKGLLGDSRLLDVALTLEDKLKDHPDFGRKPGKPLLPNVDFCSGVMLTQYLGIDERLMTSMFTVARTIGWQAHAAEHARDAAKLIRPEAIPLAEERQVIDIDSRTPPTKVEGAAAVAVFPKANKFAEFAKAA